MQAWSDSFLSWQEFLYSCRCLAEDTKNYHAWAHRAAIAEAFDSWERELPIITKMLSEDARNNSAWNHRYLTVQHLLSRSAAGWQLQSIASEIPQLPQNDVVAACRCTHFYLEVSSRGEVEQAWDDDVSCS